MENIKKKRTKSILAFTISLVLLFVFIILSTLIGGLKVSLIRLFKGIFIEYDETVYIIVKLRFPRIFVALLGGTMMAVSGVLLQAVMRNPLADPGIIGIGSGASFFAVLVTALLPAIGFLSPIFSFLGGIIAFVLVYLLSWKRGLSSVGLILVGIAINALFTGLSEAFSQMTGATVSGAQAIIDGNISLKTWSDVIIMLVYFVIGTILCLFCVRGCNQLALSDKLASSIGVNVNKQRIFISLVAVLLFSSATAIIGSVSFLALIVPHIARLLVGSDHKKLIPFSAILGALFFLAADTIGRWIAYPYEISASILISIVGGIVFIILLRRGDKVAK